MLSQDNDQGKEQKKISFTIPWFARRFLLWVLPLGFICLFFFYPLIRILAHSFGISVLNLKNLYIVGSALQFTVFQAILSTFLTLLIGIPAAFLFARYIFFGKHLLRTLTVIPFMLPTVVVAAGFNSLLGPRGWVNVFLMRMYDLESPPVTFVGTLGAILVAHVFYNTTIIIRVLGNAIEQLDPRFEWAARSLGAKQFQLWRRIFFPLLRPYLITAAILVFLFDFTSFGVILLLGGPGFSTLEVEIYIQALQMLNLPLASLLSIVQMGCTLVFSVIYTRMITKIREKTPSTVSRYEIRRAHSWQEKAFVTGTSLLLILFFIAPMLALPLRSLSRLEPARGQRENVQYALTVEYYNELFINRRGSVFYVPPIQAALNSLGYAGLTILLSLLLGFPAAFALARPSNLERFLDPLLMLPLGASAVTLGLGYIITFNRPPFRLLTSPWLIPLAHTMVALPFVIRTLQPAIASIPGRLRGAAYSLGASPLRTWFAIDWPIIWRASLAAATFAFTVSLGEFGATALLTRPEYPTIPIAIFRFLSQPGGLNYGQAMSMATILMILATLCILAIEKIRLPGVRPL